MDCEHVGMSGILDDVGGLYGDIPHSRPWLRWRYPGVVLGAVIRMGTIRFSDGASLMAHLLRRESISGSGDVTRHLPLAHNGRRVAAQKGRRTVHCPPTRS